MSRIQDSEAIGNSAFLMFKVSDNVGLVAGGFKYAQTEILTAIMERKCHYK